jgi:hypothetical protein
MSVNAAVQPLPSLDWRRWPEKQRRVYLGLPESRPRHCGGRDNGAGDMGPPNEGGLFGNSACRVGTGGRRCRVTIRDDTVGDQEGGYGTTATGGGTAGWRRSLQ